MLWLTSGTTERWGRVGAAADTQDMLQPHGLLIGDKPSAATF